MPDALHHGLFEAGVKTPQRGVSTGRPMLAQRRGAACLAQMPGAP